MNEAPLPQPLEEFLQAPPNAELSGSLRQKMLAESTALLAKRRRRWALVPAVAASIAVAFVAGYLLGRSHEPQQVSLPEQERVEHAPEPQPLQITPNAQEKLPPVVPVAEARSALDLEWKAFDTMDDKERAQLYFKAGDLYLAQERDVSGATRCYRHALNYCEPQELVDANDNWLVMALKRDQRKER